MSTGSRYYVPYAVATDSTGVPIPGALLYFYLGNSTTPANTYSDAGLSVPNTNPVVADLSTGLFPSIFLDPAITYKVTLTYPASAGAAQIWTAYPVNAPQAEDFNSYSATGTNSIVLTPINGTPTFAAYQDYQSFVFLAPNTVTGNVTIQVTGLTAYPLYSNTAQITAGQIVAGQLIVAIYTSNWNGTSTPGFVLVSAQSLNTLVTAADTGTANTYIMAPTTPLTSYSATQLIVLVPANTNTASSTLNISGNGAKQILTASGKRIGPGDLQAGGVYVLIFNAVLNGFVVLNRSLPLAGPRVQYLLGSAAGGTKTASWTANNVMVWYPTGGDPVCLGTVALSLNMANGGANGLDTGTVANSTVYHVFAIYGSSGTACLASLSATAPTMPAGYTALAKIGSVVTNGSANIRAFQQRGTATQFINTGSVAVQLASGSAGSDTGTYVAIPLGAYIPSTAQSIWITAYSAVDVVGVAPNNNYGAYNAPPNTPPLTMIGSGITGYAEFVLESTNLYWFSAGAASSVQALGYVDNL